jgi:hypothetical protein
MWTRWPLGVLGVALIVIAGCDECEEGATRCWNNTVQHCGRSDPEMGGDYTAIHWRQAAVCSPSQTCFTPPGMDPMCVLSTDPDPLCAGAWSYCSADAVVSCGAGYRVELQTCGASPIDPVFSKCVAAYSGYVACVPPEAMPNDVCAPAGSPDAMSGSSLCAGNLSVTCLAGLAVATRACASCAQRCIGFLGDICGWDGNCAVGFTCHPDSHGDNRCTAACDATDPNAVQHCEDLYVAGGPPPSLTSTPLGNSRMTCTAGFCEWTTP